METKTKQLPDGRTAYFKDGRWIAPVTDKREKELKTARDVGKIGNFSILYGSGERGLKSQIKKFYPDLSESELRKFARNAITAKRGKEINGIYEGGSDSGSFNTMQEISMKMKVPQLPCLGTKISTALRPSSVGSDFGGGRMNWTIQSSGAECLAVLLTSVHWLAEEYKIPCRFVLSIHDEVWFMTPERYSEQFAVLFQIAHMYTWSLFHSTVNIPDLPLSRAFFSSVAIDDRVRKSPKEKTVTPSNPDGSNEPYGVEYSMKELSEIGAVDKLKKRYEAIQKGYI
jgi:DNA polymerase gamma 1